MSHQINTIRTQIELQKKINQWTSSTNGKQKMAKSHKDHKQKFKYNNINNSTTLAKQ